MERACSSFAAKVLTALCALALSAAVFVALPAKAHALVEPAVSMGASHTAVLKQNGDLYMVGLNMHGELGTGDFDDAEALVKVASHVKAVSCGRHHTAYITESGDLYTAGYNMSGQLGTGSSFYFNASFTKVASNVASVSCGNDHTAFVTTTGDLYVMGGGSAGALGLGDEENRATPTFLASYVKSVSCGSWFTAYITTGGMLYATGCNEVGQLGTGDKVNRYEPTLITRGVASVSCGDYHMALVSNSGKLYVVGDYFMSAEEVGEPASAWPDLGAQVHVPYDERVTSVSCGFDTTAFVTESGKIFLFGKNSHGQLGTGDTVYYDRIVTVGKTNVRSVSCAAYGYSVAFVCGSSPTYYAMGSNEYGQLGDGTAVDRHAPVAMKVPAGQVSQTLKVGIVSPATNYNGTLSRTVSAIKSVIASTEVSYTIESAMLTANNAVGKAGDMFPQYFSLVPGAKSCQIKVAPKTPVGTYDLIIHVRAAASTTYKPATKDVTVHLKVARFAPTITVTGKVVRAVNYSKTKAKTVACPITKIQCASKPMRYELTGAKDSLGKDVSSNFKMDASTGAVTIAKGTPRGTYRLALKVYSKETSNYKGNWKGIACTVKVV